MPGRWTSPVVTASAAPLLRWTVSAEVQGPMPGISSRRARASAGVIAAASSIRRATLTARRMVEARLLSTPARCHSQDGMSDQARGSGMT